jgi:hypothetical protein
MSEQEKAQSPAPAEGVVRITAHRKLTFRNADDFESVEGFIEGTELRTNALRALKEWLLRLDDVLTEEKHTAIARTKPQPAKPATEAPPAQAAKTVRSPADDRYASLPWRQSLKLPELSTIRVDKNSDPQTLQLYEELKKAERQSLRIGRATYRISVTESGAVFLQRWTRA